MFNKEDLVLVPTKNLRLKTASRKLLPRSIGPFWVLELVSTQAYRLQLLANYKIYPVFSVSLLEKYYYYVGDSEKPDVLLLP